jgi:hypothetical protein
MTAFFDPQDIYEMRPPEDFFRGPLRRYAEGKWLPDDGEWDMAFIGMANAAEAGSGNHFTYPCCLLYDPHYHEDIIWSWLTTSWRADYPSHPRGNPWHYSLRPGTTEWGKGNYGNHPNRLVGDKGMSKVSSEHGCASGRHAEFEIGNAIIKAGCLRRASDKSVVTFPDAPECMYCRQSWNQHDD